MAALLHTLVEITKKNVKKKKDQLESPQQPPTFTATPQQPTSSARPEQPTSTPKPPTATPQPSTLLKQKAAQDTAPTSQPCKWNQPRKRKLTPKKASELVFKKYKFTEESSEKPKKTAKRELYMDRKDVEAVNVDSFADKLKKCAPHAAFLLSDIKYIKGESDDTTPTVEIKELHDPKFMYHDSVDLNNDKCQENFNEYFKNLNVSVEESKKIEENTRGQAKSKLWISAREGRITTSIFGTVCKLKETTSPECTLKSIMGYNNSFSSASVKWGTSHEAAARRVYSKNIQKTHPKLKVYQSGLVINPRYPHLGSSPDALVTCEHCLDKMGLLEIKCPYKWRFQHPCEAAKDKTFYCELLNGKLKLKHSHQYYYQVQGQMAITGRKWCDFFLWTLKGFSVERIFFDENLWAEMVLKLNKFYTNSVLPEVFSLRLKRKLEQEA